MRVLVPVGLCLTAAVITTLWRSSRGAGPGEELAGGVPVATPQHPGSPALRLDADLEPSRLTHEPIPEAAAEAGEIPAAVQGSLAGTVEDLRGEPVPGAWVGNGVGAEVETDARGRFAIPVHPGVEEISVRKQGWIQVSWPEIARDPQGGWKSARIVLAPGASLRVTVRDGSGRPVVGAAVDVVLAAAEPLGFGAERGVPHGTTVFSSTASTDEEGTARLERVPARQRLRISLQGAGPILGDRGRPASFEGVDRSGERLVGPSEASAPLVLEPGEERELTIELAVRVRVTGRVMGPSGAPSAEAIVTLRELGVGAARWPGIRLTSVAGEQGEFVLEGLLMTRPGRLLVAATTTRAGGGWTGRRIATSADPQEFASLELGPFHAGPIEADLLLELAPALSIAGRVVDGKGAPTANARVALRPLEGELVSGALKSNRVSHATTRSEDGSFHLPVVPPGTYDLEVSCSDRATVWVRGVPAGTSDLVIEVPEGVPARVTIEVTSDHPLDQVILLLSRFHPWTPSLDVPHLPGQASYSEPTGWPAPALGLWYGAQGYSDSLGEGHFASWPMRERTITRNLAEGYYWIGAKARGEGFTTYPIGTGLVFIGPGEHRLGFHLEPAGGVRGRVLSEPLEPTLCIAVFTAGGRPIPLDLRTGRMESLAALGAEGAFDLRPVPARSLELRLGSRAELEAGAFRARKTIRVPAGGTLEVAFEP